MNSNFSRKLKKLFAIIDNLHEITRKVLNIGLLFFILVLSFGLTLLLYTNFNTIVNVNLKYLSITIIKNSFTLLAQVIFVCLLIDFGIKKYEEDDDD